MAYIPICIREMWDVTSVHGRTKKVESGAVFCFCRILGRGGRGYKSIFLAQTEIKILKIFNTVLTLCFETSAGRWAAIQMKVQMKEGWGPGREMRPIKTLWCPPSGRLVAGDFPTGFLWGGDEVFWRDVSIMPKAQCTKALYAITNLHA